MNEEELVPTEKTSADDNESENAEPCGEASTEDDEEQEVTVDQEPSLEEQLSAALQESKSNYDHYLRSVAEMENYRRRSLREKEEARKYATASLVEDLLPVLDNFVLGLESARKHPEAKEITEGFNMVYRQIDSILKKNGVEEIHPLREEFDPHRHESTGYQPDDEVPEGRVVRVIRRGYALNDRLLRPAMVVLSGGPRGAESAGESEAQGSEDDQSANQSSGEK